MRDASKGARTAGSMITERSVGERVELAGCEVSFEFSIPLGGVINLKPFAELGSFLRREGFDFALEFLKLGHRSNNNRSLSRSANAVQILDTRSRIENLKLDSIRRSRASSRVWAFQFAFGGARRARILSRRCLGRGVAASTGGGAVPSGVPVVTARSTAARSVLERVTKKRR